MPLLRTFESICWVAAVIGMQRQVARWQFAFAFVQMAAIAAPRGARCHGDVARAALARS